MAVTGSSRRSRTHSSGGIGCLERSAGLPGASAVLETKVPPVSPQGSFTMCFSQSALPLHTERGIPSSSCRPTVVLLRVQNSGDVLKDLSGNKRITVHLKTFW